MRFPFHGQIKADFEVFALQTVPLFVLSLFPYPTGKTSLFFRSWSFSMQYVVNLFHVAFRLKQSEYYSYENINLRKQQPLLETFLLSEKAACRSTLNSK